MRHFPFSFLALALGLLPSLLATGPRVFPAGALPDDVRLKDLKDLDGYFPFTPPASKAEWTPRADFVRRQVLVSQGLWPIPTRTPLQAVIHGRIDQGEYTVEKVYFESAPGFFVTGNLYRPKVIKGKAPGVLFAHGHWKDARFYDENVDRLRRDIAVGAERFEEGGRSIFQSLCVQLARMGCVVWQWDMLSDADSRQFSRRVIHDYPRNPAVRPEMNTLENWGLFSAQAEANLQSVMGLQSFNSVRSLDFLLSLPEVDPERIAVTGASGGGTQTMVLAAIDPRVSLSFPCVMVSTAMQGGCVCENASLLRVNTGNIEFAALVAPRPQGLTTADDWTRELSAKGFPELKRHYETLGAPNHVMLQRGEHFLHNYNAVTRSAFYTWLNRHFKLGFKDPVIEREYPLLKREQLTVWDAEHPAPKADDAEFERRLLKWLAVDARTQIRPAAPSPESVRAAIGPAVEVLIGRTLDNTGEVKWQLSDKQDRGAHLEMTGTLRNAGRGECVPVVWLYPKQRNGRAVIWLGNEGKAALFEADGSIKPAVKRLIDAGTIVMGLDLLYQGEFLADGQPMKQTRVVTKSRDFAGYTFGYNHSLFAQRTHDILSAVRLLRFGKSKSHESPTSIAVVGFGNIGPVAAAARAVSGGAIDRLAVDTAGFRFKSLLDVRDPGFLPGGAKYLDVPGLLALGAPSPLWLAGEGDSPELVAETYRANGQSARLTAFTGPASQREMAASAWLLQ